MGNFLVFFFPENIFTRRYEIVAVEIHAIHP